MRAVPSIALIRAFSPLLLLLSTEVKRHNENEEIMKVKVIEWTKDCKPRRENVKKIISIDITLEELQNMLQ